MVCCKSEKPLLADALYIFPTDCFETYDLDPFYSVSSPGYTHERNIYESEQDVQYIRDKQLYLLIGLIGKKVRKMVVRCPWCKVF